MMLATMLAVAMLAASPALAPDEPAVVADAKAKEAKAGGATAEAECKDGYIVSKAGGVVAKAPCEPPPPPPPPKAAPAPAPATPSISSDAREAVKDGASPKEAVAEAQAAG